MTRANASATCSRSCPRPEHVVAAAVERQVRRLQGERGLELLIDDRPGELAADREVRVLDRVRRSHPPSPGRPGRPSRARGRRGASSPTPSVKESPMATKRTVVTRQPIPLAYGASAVVERAAADGPAAPTRPPRRSRRTRRRRRTGAALLRRRAAAARPAARRSRRCVRRRQPSPIRSPAATSDTSPGVTAYSAPHAPRLKNDSAIPVAMTAASVGAVPKSTAETADPTRNTESVEPAAPDLDQPRRGRVARQLGERDDQREAERAHEVVTLRRRGCDGIQMNAP